MDTTYSVLVRERMERERRENNEQVLHNYRISRKVSRPGHSDPSAADRDEQPISLLAYARTKRGTAGGSGPISSPAGTVTDLGAVRAASEINDTEPTVII